MSECVQNHKTRTRRTMCQRLHRLCKRLEPDPDPANIWKSVLLGSCRFPPTNANCATATEPSRHSEPFEMFFYHVNAKREGKRRCVGRRQRHGGSKRKWDVLRAFPRLLRLYSGFCWVLNKTSTYSTKKRSTVQPRWNNKWKSGLLFWWNTLNFVFWGNWGRQRY